MDNNTGINGLHREITNLALRCLVKLGKEAEKVDVENFASDQFYELDALASKANKLIALIR